MIKGFCAVCWPCLKAERTPKRSQSASKVGIAASGSVRIFISGFAPLRVAKSEAVSSAKVSAAPRLEAIRTITLCSALSAQAQAAQA